MAQPSARLSPQPSPILEPKVATPMAHRKRRHSTMEKGEVSHGDGSAHAQGREAAMGVVNGHGHAEHVNGAKAKEPRLEVDGTNGTSLSEKVGREDGDGRPQSSDSNAYGGNGAAQLSRSPSRNGSNVSDDSFMEDLIDTVELEPYKALDDDDFGYQEDIIKIIHHRLRRLGPDLFMREHLKHDDITPQLLGTAFGINPEIQDVYGEKFYMRLLVNVVDRAHKKREKLKQYNTIDDAAALLKEKKQIMVITGAGISTSLGIPDFRSKTSGFYTKLMAQGYAEPEQVFDIFEFDENPSAFYNLAGALLPEVRTFSPTHKFISLLQDKGKLQTNYTQNIDNLEQLAGIRPAQLIQCHGSFATATCRKCEFKVRGSDIFPEMRAKQVAYCKRCTERIATKAAASTPKKQKSTIYRNRYTSDDDDDTNIDDDIPTPGVMKPDITFFGEQLPDTFFNRFTNRDCKTVDLVLVIGTSMKVAPVSDMPNHLPKQVPHIYISREPVDHVNFDIQLLGNCDDVVFELARRAGWELMHAMIPPGFQTVVEPVEGKEHHWKVFRLLDD